MLMCPRSISQVWATICLLARADVVAVVRRNGESNNGSKVRLDIFLCPTRTRKWASGVTAEGERTWWVVAGEFTMRSMRFARNVQNSGLDGFIL